MEKTRTALLVMDMMPVVVPAFGGDDALLKRLAEAADAARGADMDVIFVRIAFREGNPDVAPLNKIFATVVSQLDFTDGTPGTEIHPSLEPLPTDFIVLKKRVSAFAGSDLELLLRSRSIGHLVLSGVATSGVVLSTLRAASDLDYELTVLADGCADLDSEVHSVLMEKVFPAQADVVDVATWISSSA